MTESPRFAASQHEPPLQHGPENPQIADIPEDGVWRRLSPRMLLIHPVREVIRYLPALIAVIFAGGSGGRHWWGLAVTGVAVAAGIARWFTTSFRFTDSQVQLRSGLLNRTTVSAPADRVRSVDVTASILHRLLGLAEVKIGTAAGEKEMKLNGLTTTEAAALRTDLLHRSQLVTLGAQPGTVDLAKGTGGADAGSPTDGRTVRPYRADGRVADDEVLYQLNPAWLRFAPFSPSGLIAALAIFGLGSQLVQDTGVDPTRSGAYQDASDVVTRGGIIASIVIGGVGLLVLVVVLSLIAYALAFFNFRLTRSRGGETLHVARGLLTTRATSLEVRRLRGVEVHEPIPLRWANGARLRAITTGLKDARRGMSALLVPPSPVHVVQQTGDRVLGSYGRLQASLRTHGHVAVRRRWTRALNSCAAAAAGVCAIGWWQASWWYVVLAGLVILVAVPLARSRIAALGHDVDERFIVGRSGALMRSTFVIERSGVVAVTVRRSLFQRRAQVSSIAVATAAGSGSYLIIDVTAERGDELVDQVSGGLAAQFSRRCGVDGTQR